MTDGQGERHRGLVEGLIDGREDWRNRIHALMGAAADRGARRLVMLDESFEDWPLGEPAFIDALSRWVASHRELVLLAADFGAILRRHPRWVTWRRTWGHTVRCLALHEDDRAEVPALFMADGVGVLQMADRRHWRGSLRSDPAAMAQAHERLEHLVQRGSPDFPVSVLGL